MSGYAILTMKKYHTFPQLHGQQKHNNREIPMPHIDGSKSILNQFLVNPGCDYTQAWRNRIQSAETQYNRKIKMRNDSVINLEFVLTYSPEADVPVKKWAEVNAQWLKDKFGVENVLACTLHMDETTPHIHASIIPIDDRGHLCAKSFINGPFSLKKLQDDYSKEMAQFGLQRGEKHSKSRKKSLQEFYDAVNEIDHNPAPEPFIDESEEEYIKRLRDYIRMQKLALYNLQLKVDRSEELIESNAYNQLYKYHKAIDLYEQLAENFGDEELDITERLGLYHQLEQCVPRHELDKVLYFLKDKYPMEHSILATMDKINQKSK